MKAIIKREFKNYIKNPILWITLLLLGFGIYQNVEPYLQLQRPNGETQESMEGQSMEEIVDMDIMDGYIPAPEEEQIKYGLEEIGNVLVENFGVKKEEASQYIEELRRNYSRIPDVVEAIKETYDYKGWDSYFETYKYCPGDSEQVNSYIDSRLEEHPFSWYIALKFADFASLFMGFTAAVLLAFLYIRDVKRDTYELLHTKPVSSEAYILGKAAGGMAVILFMLTVLNLVFGVLCVISGRREGFPVNFMDFPKATLLYIVPNMLMIVSVYTIAALVFRNPLPAMPIIFLYMIYSNMGSVGSNGNFGYYGRPLAIMVRFPGRLLEISPPPMWKMNQIFLVIASAVLLFVSANIWKRRRFY